MLADIEQMRQQLPPSRFVYKPPREYMHERWVFLSVSVQLPQPAGRLPSILGHTALLEIVLSRLQNTTHVRMLAHLAAAAAPAAAVVRQIAID